MEGQRGTIWYYGYVEELSVLHRNYYHSSEKQRSHITWPVFGCIWQKGFKEKETTTLWGWQYTSLIWHPRTMLWVSLPNKWAARLSDPARTGLCVCRLHGKDRHPAMQTDASSTCWNCRSITCLPLGTTIIPLPRRPKIRKTQLEPVLLYTTFC